MMVGYDRRSDTPARMTNRLYEGTGDGYESRLTVDGRSLAMHNDLGNHSPDDPNSSYFGSGPTQLEAPSSPRRRATTNWERATITGSRPSGSHHQGRFHPDDARGAAVLDRRRAVRSRSGPDRSPCNTRCAAVPPAYPA